MEEILLVQYMCPNCKQVYACNCSGCLAMATDLPRVNLTTKGILCSCGYHGDYSVPLLQKKHLK